MGVGGTLVAAGRARGETDVVVRRREHTAVEVGGVDRCALHERAPRRRQAVLAGSMGERDEEPGLGRHRVVDAELVDEAQALLDVPVGRSRVATKIGEHALDVFEPAAREALTEPVGDRAGVVDVRLARLTSPWAMASIASVTLVTTEP